MHHKNIIKLEEAANSLKTSPSKAAEEFRETFEKSKELTTCAFEAAKKPHLYRLPLEVNLLMCMLFKIFRRIEPLISKRFRLLASLAAKM